MAMAWACVIASGQRVAELNRADADSVCHDVNRPGRCDCAFGKRTRRIRRGVATPKEITNPRAP
jgi:hypothetical protein